MNFDWQIWTTKVVAAVLNIDSNLADFATVSATGKKKHDRFWYHRARSK
jgi:hypothetical protein